MRLTLLLGLFLLNSTAFAGPYKGQIPTKDDRFTYMAHITRVIDGDTVVADIDLGFFVWHREQRLRLNRIDADEIRGKKKTEKGEAAYKWLKEKVEGKWLVVRTVADRKGSFGRYLIELFLDGKNVNDELVESRLATYREP